jgi:predicted ferric reductase
MAIIKKYPVLVKGINSSIEGIYTIEFESLSKPFRYEPGQFLHLAIDEHDASDQWPDSRCFSMQSSPDENTIRITYAVKGRFTQRMFAELKPGSIATLKLPYGNLFSQTHNKSNTVFIAGGTGITPYLSLFTHSSFENYKNPMLFAGFRSENLNIYIDELNKALTINPGLIIKIYYQDRDGILDISNIASVCDKNSTCFISGPPQMIGNFRQYLLKEGLIPDQIRTDDWE